LKDLDFEKPIDTALAWSRETNALVCTHGKAIVPATVCISLYLTGTYSFARRTRRYCRSGTWG
jgi:hypothetical protein